jgi:hypothetical protein
MMPQILGTSGAAGLNAAEAAGNPAKLTTAG